MTQAILYSSIRSPHCLKVAMVLSEKGIPFERVEIDLPAREQKSPAFLAKNPLGLVPVYEDDQGIHCDSLVIMQYLDRRYPQEPRLFPDEPGLRQQVLDWIELSSGPMRDVSHHLYWQLIEPPEAGPDQEEVARLKAQGLELLARLDAALAAAPYVCGPLTAADFAIIPWVYGYQRFNLPPAGQFLHAAAWRDAMAARPSFAANFQQKGRPFQPEEKPDGAP